jgi:hypothetical protein
MKTSSELIANIDKVLKCKEIPTAIKNYYSVANAPFLKKYNVSTEGSRAKEIVRGALFYSSEAMQFFSFFGVDFENPSKSKALESQGAKAESISHFLFSSIKQLYVILWETFRGFFEPLEDLYSIRLCESGIFPKTYQLFPYSVASEKTELNFREFFIRRGTFYRISESLPFELRFAYKAAQYFKDCFDNGKKKTQASDTEEYMDDFIRLFFVRNHVCHLKNSVINQSDAEKQQTLFHDLSTLLPKVQDSCIGIIGAFEEIAKNEIVGG